MLKKIINTIKRRYNWFRLSRVLDNMTSMAQFKAYIGVENPPEFARYSGSSEAKRQEFLTVTAQKGIHLKGLRVLDIGPAYGDSLDVAYEQGARSTSFVELEPFFYTYNRLKPYTKGYRLNHLFGLKALPAREYDLIWIKGSVLADIFLLLGGRALSASKWLGRLEALAAPGCHLIICPHWRNGGREMSMEAVSRHPFTQLLLNRGYSIMPYIEHHNHPVEFPVTFYKRMI